MPPLQSRTNVATSVATAQAWIPREARAGGVVVSRIGTGI